MKFLMLVYVGGDRFEDEEEEAGGGTGRRDPPGRRQNELTRFGRFGHR